MTAPLSGEILGRRYVLQNEIGHGGMGAVYQALDRLTGQEVAVKRVHAPKHMMLSSPVNDSQDVRRILAQEFRILASLRHPRIISVLDYGFDDAGHPFIVMELLQNAQNLLDAARGKPPAEYFDLLVQILQALDYLHRRNVLHRDLKPGNVLVVDGSAKVLDFGLSRSGRDAAEPEDTTAGTLAYMAPEIVKGEPASPASDLYALGVLAYQLYAGSHPFDVHSLNNLVADIMQKTPDMTLVESDPVIVQVIARLMEKEPEHRFHNVREIRDFYERHTRQRTNLETDATRESFLQAAEFVGREKELSYLTGALNRAHNNQGSSILIAGESGVGKSRLLDELRIEALVTGAFVLRGQTTSERGAVYQVWRDPIRWLCLQVTLSDLETSVLKEIVPDIGTLLDEDVPDPPELSSQASQDRLLEVVEAIFRRQQQPIVLILEDLHWAGSESLRVLLKLNRVINELPLLMIASYRDDERPDLPTLLPDMEIIHLERLSEASIAALSESMLGKVGRDTGIIRLLQRETEGNVFFLVEVVRTLAEEAGTLENVSTMTLPHHVFAGGVQMVIQRRLDHVPEQDHALLKAAAIIGRKLDLALLNTISKQQGEPYQPTSLAAWLTNCQNAAVLDVMDNQWQFAHDKLREGLLADLSDDERQALNRIAAEAIETYYGDSPEKTAALAQHWAQANHKPKAVHYLDKAGAQMVASYSNQEAIQFLNQAMALDDVPKSEATRERRIRREALLGQAYLGIGALEDSHQHLEKALVLLRERMPATRKRLIASLIRHISRQLGYRVMPPRRVRDADKREKLLEAARIYERLSELYYFDNDTLSTLYCAVRTLNLAERAGVSPELARAYANMTVATALVSLRKLSAVYKRRAIETAAQIDDAATQARVLSRTGLVESGLGNWSQARQNLEESRRIAQAIGDNRQWGEAMGILVNVVYQQGEFANSYALCNELLERGIHNGDKQHQVWGLTWGAQSAIRMNRLDEAETKLRQGIEITTELIGYSVGQVINYGLLALTMQRFGDMSQARAFADHAYELIRTLPPPTSFAQVEGYACTAGVYLRLWEHAGTADAELMSAAEGICAAMFRYARRFPMAGSRAWRFQGLLDWLKGDVQKAHTSWQKSLSFALDKNMPYEEARTCYEIGRHSADDAERERYLQRARAIFVRLDAPYDITQTDGARRL